MLAQRIAEMYPDPDPDCPICGQPMGDHQDTERGAFLEECVRLLRNEVAFRDDKMGHGDRWAWEHGNAIPVST